MRDAAIGGAFSRSSLRAVPVERPLPIWKRALDFFLILVFLPGLAIASLLAIVIIKLTSPGPVLFCQERVGYRGRRFRLCKFRTMHIGAETQSHQRHVERLMRSGKPMEKLDSGNDPRMIPFASILRATGIDELPQVLNIMKGDMSFVGPRPCVPYEYEKYEPRHRARLNAVPGLTGLWQVSGKNRTTFERMVQLDVEYSTCFSFWMDISIILRTFGALARQCKDLRERKKSASVSDGSFAGVSNCNLQKS